MDSPSKKISVLIPCRNEVQTIEECVRDAFNFDPPYGGFEVIVIDGMSDDGTRDILFRMKKRYPDLKVIDNHHKTAPFAMNLGIQHAEGEYIARTDPRCKHPKRYLCDLLELSEKTGADNVGGVLDPLGETYTQKSIAVAFRSPIAMGVGLRDRGDAIREVDTVYGGFFRRDRIIEVGMYDEKMARNQDDELSFRIREKGGKIIQDRRIKIQYYPRKYFSQLFKQFLQYGYWKVAVVKKHPKQSSLRHLVPLVLVSCFTILGLLAPFHRYAFNALVGFAVCYLFPLSLEALRLSYGRERKLWPGVFVAIFYIHTSFGVGFMAHLIFKMFNIKSNYFETLSR